ncbi:Hypothetical predicted protein [Olea europaea subsp. europaea]|uniref:Transmembrane protein n=1 Tax=Olea europaea subsp. europaea TaxID=158383 RepID=A0A8S0U2W3_OLEEU|nr:Hypothetical predicted protein [Olea europaea subsp. europaea]
MAISGLLIDPVVVFTRVVVALCSTTLIWIGLSNVWCVWWCVVVMVFGGGGGVSVGKGDVGGVGEVVGYVLLACLMVAIVMVSSDEGVCWWLWLFLFLLAFDLIW